MTSITVTAGSRAAHVTLFNTKKPDVAPFNTRVEPDRVALFHVNSNTAMHIHEIQDDEPCCADHQPYFEFSLGQPVKFIDSFLRGRILARIESVSECASYLVRFVDDDGHPKKEWFNGFDIEACEKTPECDCALDATKAPRAA